MAKQITPPFKPSVKSALDVANFDAEFLNEAALDSVVDSGNVLPQTVHDQFKGFTYIPDSEMAQMGESVGV